MERTEEFNESAAVDISYQPAQVNIEVDTLRPVINVDPGEVIHQYTPANITTNMAQYPELNIDVVFEDRQKLDDLSLNG